MGIGRKQGSVRFRRNMTALTGVLFRAWHRFKHIFIFTSPWTEYALADRVDSYQLGLGILSGQAYGIVPSPTTTMVMGDRACLGNGQGRTAY